MFSKDLLEKFLQPYGLRADRAKFLRHSQNFVYSCHSSGKQCIIRISNGRYRSKSEVESEIFWILFLKERGINTCAPIPTETGERCASFDIHGETYIVTCFEHALGKEIRRQDINEALLEQLGMLVGRMHTESAAFNASRVNLDRPHWHESRLLREDLNKEGLTGTFRDSVADLIPKLSDIPRSSQNHGLIHGDVSFGNTFVQEGDLWIFDFDNCEYGYFLQELGTVLYDSIYCKVLNKFADTRINERIIPLWNAFLYGYSKTGMLKEIHPLLLKRFFLLREAVIYAHYHRTLDLRGVDDSFKAGMEVMRRNVEEQEHQVDVEYILRSQPHIKIN